MSKKKNAVMLADTRPALVGVVLMQLEETNKGLFDEAIIYDSTKICEADKRKMQNIMPCRFIKYKCPLPDEVFKKPRFKLFSPLMFARYEMMQYLEEFETITWLDTDILIQGDISGLVSAAKSTGAAFIREDPLHKTAEKTDRMRTCFNRQIEGYHLNDYLYCSGTIVYSDRLRKIEKFAEWCYEKTYEWADILELPDQGVLNAAIQNFHIQVTAVTGKVYCCYPYMNRDCSDAKIIHAWGLNKFWNDWYINQNYRGWNEKYEEWVKGGGSSLPFHIEPEISVVIPTYKPDINYFRQCLDSLMEQTRDNWERYSNFEIIIIAEPFEKQQIINFLNEYHDNRIRLIFNDERVGIAGSLNRGLQEAQGKYIARMDDDDFAAVNRLYLQKKYLDSHEKVVLCTTDFEYFGDMNERRVAFEGEMARAWALLTCPFDHPTVMFRKSFFDKHGLQYDEKQKYAEDWDLWLRAFDKGMTVGCIHEALLYHRWHNGSAGQSEASSRRMKEIVQSNFRKLGVEISWDDVPVFCPWWGKAWNDDVLSCLENSFEKALEANEKLGFYDQESLKKAFGLRLAEAQTGTLPDLSWSTGSHDSDITEELGDRMKKPGRLRSIFKKILKPLYQPFRHRYEDRLIELQTSVWQNEGHLLNCITKLDQVVSEQKRQLLQMKEALSYECQEQLLQMKEALSYECQEQLLQMKEAVEDGQKKQLAQMKEAVENEREKRLAQMKEILNEMQTQMAENVYSVVDSRTWKTEEQLLQKDEQILDETHRHIDFVYRDIMIALYRQAAFLPEYHIILKTEYPIAYESLDHLYPHGTIRDNTRYPRFVEKCEEILSSKKKLAFLDLGCSGGGMVLEAALRGHISFGLEGSDNSKKEQRAEWRLLGDRLQTCDITKKFSLQKDSGEIQEFDVITAWEVLEHIAESDLPHLFENIKRHLSPEGYFVGSIANWDDVDSVSGVNWHVTVHPYEWWEEKFAKAGFEICTGLFDTIDLARGGYNPPHCYEKPYPDVDTEKSFHIVVRKKDEYKKLS